MQQQQNARIIVRYDDSVCTHAGKCVQGLPAVFDVSKDPWINVDGAPVEAIAVAVARCPSGALRCEILEATGV